MDDTLIKKQDAVVKEIAETNPRRPWVSFRYDKCVGLDGDFRKVDLINIIAAMEDRDDG